MRPQYQGLLFWCLGVSAEFQTQSLFWERAGTTALSPPACALPCLVTLVPEYCVSLTNSTCICTNQQLAVETQSCVFGKCNITESLSLARYKADSCGIINDKSRHYEQLRTNYIIPPLVFCFLLSRIYARVMLDVGLGPDDWMIIAAFGAYITDVGTGVAIAMQGFGEHTYYLTEHQLDRALFWFYISELFYLLTITLTKLSLLLFFRRIFPNKNFRIAIWMFFGFVIASNFAITMTLTFQCLPFHGNWTNWKYKVAPVKCINSFAAVYVAAGLSIFHDCVILAMPIPILWKLNLPWQKKANIMVMFSVGSFVIVCSVLRLPSLLVLKASTDPSYDQAPIAVWTHLELGVGIMCACLPACRSLIGYHFPSLKMTLGPTSAGETPGYSSSQSRSNKRLEKKGVDASTGTFIELHDHVECQEELERGKTVDGASIISQGSEVPIAEKLVPHNWQWYGHRTTVGVKESGEGRVEGDRMAIVMTRTIEQSTRQRF